MPDDNVRVVRFLDEVLVRGDENGVCGAHIRYGRAIFDPPDEVTPEYMIAAPVDLASGPEALEAFKRVIGDDLAARLAEFIATRTRAEAAEASNAELSARLETREAQIVSLQADLAAARAQAAEAASRAEGLSATLKEASDARE